VKSSALSTDQATAQRLVHRHSPRGRQGCTSPGYRTLSTDHKKTKQKEKGQALAENSLRLNAEQLIGSTTTLRHMWAKQWQGKLPYESVKAGRARAWARGAGHRATKGPTHQWTDRTLSTNPVPRWVRKTTPGNSHKEQLKASEAHGIRVRAQDSPAGSSISFLPSLGFVVTGRSTCLGAGKHGVTLGEVLSCAQKRL